MSKNFIIVLVSLFLVFTLGVTFFVWSYRLNENRNVPEESLALQDMSYIDETGNESESNEYLKFSLYKNDRTKIDLSEYENSALVLLFFDDTDETSIDVLNKMEEIYKKYNDSAKFLMIDVNPNINEELNDKYTLEIYYDLDKKAITNYHAYEYPFIIYIDENNEIKNTKTGITTLDAIEANLDLITNNI